MSEILTKTQELRHFENTLEALKNLVNAPESKDLLKSIQLGALEKHEDYLFLTNQGLAVFNDKDRSKIIKPSVALIKEYRLNEKELNDLLARLRA